VLDPATHTGVASQSTGCKGRLRGEADGLIFHSTVRRHFCYDQPSRGQGGGFPGAAARDPMGAGGAFAGVAKEAGAGMLAA